MEKKLEVNNLRISFRTDAGKVQAVRGIDFDLYKGETLAIVGESGSGKSVTNKAIIGISASNAIIESGEILYDGMDLVQISEDDFHKLRGDKIAMIFQDPLSALDPIVRIGSQLTEAMLLKDRANRRESNNCELHRDRLRATGRRQKKACISQSSSPVGRSVPVQDLCRWVAKKMRSGDRSTPDHREVSRCTVRRSLWSLPYPSKDLAEWLLLANHVCRYKRIRPAMRQMPEARRNYSQRCNAPQLQSPSGNL